MTSTLPPFSLLTARWMAIRASQHTAEGVHQPPAYNCLSAVIRAQLLMLLHIITCNYYTPIIGGVLNRT